MFERVKQGEQVVVIQSDQEKILCKQSSQPIASEDCKCEEGSQCSCLGFFKKERPDTHASVEIAQSIVLDKKEGTQKTTFIIQKVADYENFVEDQYDSAED